MATKKEDGKHIGSIFFIYYLLLIIHTPHECRHTFITIGKSNKMDQYILKLIVGHEIDDVTEKFYTHRTIEQLRNEMNACITKHISMKNKDLFIDDMYD